MQLIEFPTVEKKAWDWHHTLWKEWLRLAQEGQLMAYRHDGFWQCMDTTRDLHVLRTLWAEGRAP